ncbi:hypothetical protein Tco_0476117, partial [Tanacetum coccineum]
FDFLRFPHGKENLVFLKSLGLHLKVNYLVDLIVLSDVQAAANGLCYKDMHLNHPVFILPKKKMIKTHKKMCASVLHDEGTIRLICNKSVFEKWIGKQKAADNKFVLPHETFVVGEQTKVMIEYNAFSSTWKINDNRKLPFPRYHQLQWTLETDDERYLLIKNKCHIMCHVLLSDINFDA